MKYKLNVLTAAIVVAGLITASAQDTNENPNSSSTKPWRNSSVSGSNDVSRSELAGNTNAVSDADNTGRNARDRDGNTLTPLNQSNSQTDLNITSQIRKEIIADKNLSVNAHNVKIITANGYVTLRGSVNTSTEKREICDVAKRIAGSQNVQDQLEVKTDNSSN